MVRQFSPRTFFRQTPNDMLRRYFESKGILIGIEWSELGETEVETIFEAMDQMEEHSRQRVEGDFLAINELACSKGVLAILEEARFWDRDWSDQFAEMSNDYERAMWAFLNEPRRFETAGAFHEMDRVRFNWHRFVGYRLEVQTGEVAREIFGAALSAYYRRQGRGRHCHVDVYGAPTPNDAASLRTRKMPPEATSATTTKVGSNDAPGSLRSK